MTDENRFLNLGNSNDKISYDNFKGKLEKKDIGTNNKLLQIFNFFDKDGNGIIETANSKGANEMQSLWNALRTSATKNSNSIFEDSEAQELLANSVDSSGLSLANCNVTSNDLFGFLKLFLNKPAETPLQPLSPEEVYDFTPEEIQEHSLNSIVNNLYNAKEIFNLQREQQGFISDAVDDIKNAFDTEYSSSRVNRCLMVEETTAILLLRAKEGDLTIKDYLEAKINLAKRMLLEFQNSKQKRLVEECEISLLDLEIALKSLTPVQLTVFIKRLTSLSDEEYEEQVPNVIKNMINYSATQKNDHYNNPVLERPLKKILVPGGGLSDLLNI